MIILLRDEKKFCPSSSILAALMELSFLYEWESGRTVLETEQIDQNCAINCGIPGNASNKNTTKSKNLTLKVFQNPSTGLRDTES